MPTLSSIITPNNIVTSDNELTLTNKTIDSPIITVNGQPGGPRQPLVFDENGGVTFGNGDSFSIPAGGTGERPGNPNTGELRFNTDTSELEQYDGTNWVSVVPDDIDLNSISINGTQIVDSTGNVDTGSISINGTLLTDGESIRVPSGTTGERPASPATGELRFNTDLNLLEQYDGTEWGSVGGGDVDADSLSIGGTEVIDNSRKLAEFRVNTQTISSNTNASTGVFYVATAELTLTLPSSPSVGDIVGFQNSSDTEECVIARNGENILSLAEDMTIDALNASVNLQYSGSSAGWVFV